MSLAAQRLFELIADRDRLPTLGKRRKELTKQIRFHATILITGPYWYSNDRLY